MYGGAEVERGHVVLSDREEANGRVSVQKIAGAIGGVNGTHSGTNGVNGQKNPKRRIFGGENGFRRHFLGHSFYLPYDPYLAALITAWCKAGANPLFTEQVKKIFEILFLYALRTFATKRVTAVTRMEWCEGQRAVITEDIPDFGSGLRILEIARAGNEPCQAILGFLNLAFWQENGVQRDHACMEREFGPDGHMAGTRCLSFKTESEPADGATIAMPDPICATGGTFLEARCQYLNRYPGRSFKFLFISAIGTPEAAAALRDVPDATIIFGHYSRAGSPEYIGSTLPGETEVEAGLNKHCYVIGGPADVGKRLSEVFAG